MDITPLVPAGRQIIEAYGEGRFVIGGVAFAGSVLVFSERTVSWSVGEIGELTVESLADVTNPTEGVEILLLGCGPRLAIVSAEIRRWLRERGIVVESMDTGAACRTFNVLLAEERRVAAALIPVS